LTLDYENYHDTTPCFFGSKEEIIKVLRTYKENK